MVACFDADPLFEHPSALRLAREFAAARNPETGSGARLHVCESAFSLTGSRADHRVRGEFGKGACDPGSGRTPPGLCPRPRVARERPRPSPVPTAPAPHRPKRSSPKGWRRTWPRIRDTASSWSDRGRRPAFMPWRPCSMTRWVRSGRGSPIRPISIRNGPRISLRSRSWPPSSSRAAVETLLILGGNPVYDAPADLGFPALLAGVPVSAHLSLYDDETSQPVQLAPASRPHPRRVGRRPRLGRDADLPAAPHRASLTVAAQPSRCWRCPSKTDREPAMNWCEPPPEK